MLDEAIQRVFPPPPYENPEDDLALFQDVVHCGRAEVVRNTAFRNSGCDSRLREESTEVFLADKVPLVSGFFPQGCNFCAEAISYGSHGGTRRSFCCTLRLWMRRACLFIRREVSVAGIRPIRSPAGYEI